MDIVSKKEDWLGFLTCRLAHGTWSEPKHARAMIGTLSSTPTRGRALWAKTRTYLVYSKIYSGFVKAIIEVKLVIPLWKSLTFEEKGLWNFEILEIFGNAGFWRLSAPETSVSLVLEA